MSRHRKHAKHPANRPQATEAASYFATLRDYVKLLFDLSFTHYLTIKMLPIFYLIIVMSGLGFIAYMLWAGFNDSLWRGLLYTLASPMAALFWISACRATTEFLLAVFRMSANVERLAELKNTADRLEKAITPAAWLGRMMTSGSQQKTPAAATPAIHPEKKS